MGNLRAFVFCTYSSLIRTFFETLNRVSTTQRSTPRESYHFIFQHTINVCLQAVDSNFGLFNYQRIRPVDTVLARVLLEAIITIATGLLLAGILAFLGFHFKMDNPLGFLLALFLLGSVSLGLGLLVSVLGMTNEFQKIVPILIRPLFFLSGVFFMTDEIPQPYQDYLLLNPILQSIELIRSTMFADYKTPVQGPGYLTTCTLLALFVGLTAYHGNWRKIITSGTK